MTDHSLGGYRQRRLPHPSLPVAHRVSTDFSAIAVLDLSFAVVGAIKETIIHTSLPWSVSGRTGEIHRSESK